MEYFTRRRTKHANYKIGKTKATNGQKIYHVNFKEWLMGWYTVQRLYDSVTSVDREFKSKEDAKKYIEDEISNAYKKLR